MTINPTQFIPGASSPPSMPVGSMMASNLLFETEAARRALSESRAEESIRNMRLFELGAKIRFQASRGMSRASLERIYGREIVTDVLAAMRQAEASVAAESSAA